MRTALSRRRGLVVCVVGVALATTGCGSSGGSAASAGQVGTRAPTAVAASLSVTPAPSAVTGRAHGGGDFCTLIAEAGTSPSIGGTSAASIQRSVDEVRGKEQLALDLAPSAIKSDVTLLFAASDAVYAKLAEVHYDYSKLTVADMAALSSPAVTLAERHLKTYVTDVCKIS